MWNVVNSILCFLIDMPFGAHWEQFWVAVAESIAPSNW